MDRCKFTLIGVQPNVGKIDRELQAVLDCQSATNSERKSTMLSFYSKSLFFHSIYLNGRIASSSLTFLNCNALDFMYFLQKGGFIM